MAGSIPTVANEKPNIPMIRDFNIDVPAKVINRAVATIISEKNSVGPNFSAY